MKSQKSAPLWKWQYILMLISLIVAIISTAGIWYSSIYGSFVKNGVVIENNDNKEGIIVVGGKNKINTKSE